MAALFLTSEASHAQKTRASGNSMMMSLIEKMKQRVPAPGSRAQVRDDDDCPGMMCPGDWCCTDGKGRDHLGRDAQPATATHST